MINGQANVTFHKTENEGEILIKMEAADGKPVIDSVRERALTILNSGAECLFSFRRLLNALIKH